MANMSSLCRSPPFCSLKSLLQSKIKLISQIARWEKFSRRKIVRIEIINNNNNNSSHKIRKVILEITIYMDKKVLWKLRAQYRATSWGLYQLFIETVRCPHSFWNVRSIREEGRTITVGVIKWRLIKSNIRTCQFRRHSAKQVARTSYVQRWTFRIIEMQGLW